MKTVIINGSPRNNGDTAALISALTEQVGKDVMQFDAYDGSIAPCIDCRACQSSEQCAINDSFNTLLEAINAADIIVIASPVYFSELTGPLLSVASRLQYVWVSDAIHHRPVLDKKPRRGIILLTAGGQGSHTKALETATCLLHQMGVETIDSVCSVNTDRTPAEQDEAAKQRIRALFHTA